jgi:hypothetical protein
VKAIFALKIFLCFLSLKRERIKLKISPKAE